jgi:hypothetical protein
VRGVAQPARVKNKPMLVDANTARRQKFNNIRHLSGGGELKNPDARENPVRKSSIFKGFRLGNIPQNTSIYRLSSLGDSSDIGGREGRELSSADRSSIV